MKQAITKAQIAAEIGSHFGTVFQYDEQPQPEFLSTGLALFDQVTSRGLPRGAITEIWGSQSSGRISVMLSALAYAAGNAEVCALVDVNDCFDLQCANTARIQFERLLWVRCSKSIERAFKAIDLLLQSRGFGLIVLNLADVRPTYLRRIVSSWWFRFRLAVENTPTVLVVISSVACVRSSAALVIEMKYEDTHWRQALTGNNINQGLESESCHLSLVKSATKTPLQQQSAPSYSHLFEGINIRIKREKPVFNPTELENIPAFAILDNIR